jgi:hypothetical protein
MILASLASIIDSQGIVHQLWQGVAACASAVAMWAHARAERSAIDPVDDLTELVRHPVRWTFRHPLIAVKRKIDRRANGGKP